MCMRYIAYWGGKNNIVFMGDSRIRQLYYAFTRLVSAQTMSDQPDFGIAAHHDLTFHAADLNLNINFLWRPVLNGSVFQTYREWLNEDAPDRPKIVVTGSGTWSIKTSNASTTSLEEYKTNLTRLLSQMDAFGNSGQVLWVLQDPVVPEKLSKDRQMISNEQIDMYNKAALDVLKYSSSEGVRVWSSARLVSQGYNWDSDDGLHMGNVALNYAVQIMLNMYCNDQMNYPDGTCCSDPEPVTGIQIATFSFFVISIILAIGFFIRNKFFRKKQAKYSYLINNFEMEDINSNDSVHQKSLNQTNSSNQDGHSSQTLLDHVEDQDMHDMSLAEEETTDQHEDVLVPEAKVIRNGGIRNSQMVIPEEVKSYTELVSCLAKFGLIMFYVFICDRTNFFMKENKYYTHPNFFLPIAYVFSLGLFFTDESRSMKTSTATPKCLNRDQTDEWKGWMQLVILTYHMTGASQVLPIYVYIRLLVTTYLFLTGFGHFTYFWHTGDHGLHRLWQVCFIPIFGARTNVFCPNFTRLRIQWSIRSASGIFPSTGGFPVIISEDSWT